MKLQKQGNAAESNGRTMSEQRVRFRTAFCQDAPYTACMQLQQTNLQQANAVAAMWILAAGVIGLGANVTSLGGAAMVLGFGLLPPILLMLRPSLLMLRPSHSRQTVSDRGHRAHS